MGIGAASMHIEKLFTTITQPTKSLKFRQLSIEQNDVWVKRKRCPFGEIHTSVFCRRAFLFSKQLLAGMGTKRTLWYRARILSATSDRFTRTSASL